MESLGFSPNCCVVAVLLSLAALEAQKSQSHWHIKSYIPISPLHADKMNNILADMRNVLATNPRIEQQKFHRRVFLEEIDPINQDLKILISCFVKTSNFEEYVYLKEDILLDLLRVVGHHRTGLAIPICLVDEPVVVDSKSDENFTA